MKFFQKNKIPVNPITTPVIKFDLVKLNEENRQLTQKVVELETKLSLYENHSQGATNTEAEINGLKERHLLEIDLLRAELSRKSKMMEQEVVDRSILLVANQGISLPAFKPSDNTKCSSNNTGITVKTYNNQ